MAEIELSVLSRQCFHGYLSSKEFLETERNSQRDTIDWRFTTGDARIKLKKLYLVIFRDGDLKETLPLKA